MYYLCGKEAEDLHEEGSEDAKCFRDMQINFYFKAMKPWIKEFCTAIQGGTANEFYKNVAACLESFFSSCEKYFGEGSTVKMA